jgi:hypothetical protein
VELCLRLLVSAIMLILNGDTGPIDSVDKSLKLLENLHVSTLADGDWGKIRLPISRMRKILEPFLYGLLTINASDGDDLLFQCTKLAMVYSSIQEFELAEALFHEIIPHFDGREEFLILDSYMDTMTQSTAHIEYALHLQRKGRLRKSAEILLLIYYDLMSKVNRRYNDALAALEGHLSSLQQRLDQNTYAYLISYIHYTLQPESSLPPTEITRKIENCKDDETMDTTSNKYGVTYSVSDITGISYSHFMVP